MWDDLFRGLREILEAEQLRHASVHLLEHVIQEYLPHLWEWAKEHIGTIFEAVSDWFSF